MSRLLILFPAFLLSIGHEAELAISVRKFVYQKDMSEYCRRRVMPSVFLGRHVVQSHTQILHFSQLEVPYSCFISVRTESGSNIILVVQLSDEQNLREACEADPNQMMVYEMGETFGGYWGPLPEAVLIHDDYVPVTYYTKRTTTPTTTVESPTEEESVEETTEAMPTGKAVLQRGEQDYIVVEVPLANVSGQMQLSNQVPERAHTDEIFDLVYDVTRKRGDRYDASMLPLVQFSIHSRQRGSERSGGDDDDVPRFQLDYDLGEFTPDPRLSFWNFSGALNRNKNKYNANRRLNFKKHKGHTFLAKGIPSYSKRRPFSQRSFDIFTKRFVGKKQTSESWSDIENFLENFDNRSLQLQRAKEDGIEYKNISSMLHNIANSNNNLSAYLIPNKFPVSKIANNIVTRFNFGSYTRNPLPTARLTKFILGDNKKISSKMTTIKPDLLLLPPMQSMTLGPIIERSSTDDSNIDKTFDKMIVQKWIDSTIEHITTTTLKEHNDELNDTEINSKISNVGARIEKVFNSGISYKTSDTSSKVTANPPAGTTVDHESWDNVVQAAPVMAVLLNHSATNVSQENNKKAHTKARKKRYIQAIAVENGRPHGLSTIQEIVTTVEPMFNFADMQDFAQLVELQDDEIHGRIALRYLRRYLGETLLNICDNHETKNRHVFLFNSSRVVIALSNFTMKRMTLVATPARTLMSADARCPQAYLECQVSGARVCIDSMTACDGVPNCGAYDIYDEDRLRCGAAKGLQHNVYLAAFTFLALLLTVFYTLHYWLKRCVPKVSDAFFIFMDGSENVLYLDSVMRSPHDTDVASKMFYRGSLFENDTGSVLVVKEKGFFTKFKKFFNCCSRRRKSSKGHIDDVCLNDFYLGLYEPKKMYSFTECEIQKMMGMGSNKVDKLCQTGESLENDFFNEIKEKTDKVRLRKRSKEEHNLKPENIFPLSSEDSRQVPQESELSMLRFMKEARSEAEKQSSEDKARSVDRHDVACGEEQELYSTFYEYPPHSKDMERPGPSGYQRKRIRFDENVTTTAEVTESNEANRSGHGPDTNSQSLNRDMDEEQHSAGRDFMRFFAGKSKKSKKEKKTNTLKFV